MELGSTYRWCSIRIAFGVITLAILLLAGGAGAANQINSCTTIDSPGEYVLNKSILNSRASSCIKITSSDVIFDGSGYTIDGIIESVSRISDFGVYVHNPATALTNVTVRNLNVTGWYIGIYYNNTEYGTIHGNNVSNNILGIFLISSSNNTLSDNNVSDNGDGIDVFSSSNYNILSGNNVSNNRAGIILGDSSNNTIRGNNVSSNIGGILVGSSSNNNLSGNNVIGREGSGGISLDSSSNNTLSNNKASNNSYDGISLASSSNNMLNSNNASYNGKGISLHFSSSNNLSGNDVSNNRVGVFMLFSSNNTLTGNIANWNVNEGISVISSSNNDLSGNNASNNNIGIYVNSSSNNALGKNSANSNNISGIFLDSLYLFSWDEIAIAGKHNFRLIEYLRQKFGIDWLKTATVEKTNYSKTIKVSKNKNYLFLKLNDEKTSVNLEIDDGRTDKFIAKIENGNLNIYDPSSNNTIYNNFFNNTKNFRIDDSVNKWNITKTKSLNIIGGPYLGGNVWSNPNVTGASQICEDGDSDGICDSSYILDSNNIDYLPLTYKPPAIPAETTKAPTEKVAGFEVVLAITTLSVMVYIFWRKKR